jgi:serine/threonine protein kinase
MKYCPSCGARYEEAAKFCQHDGSQLRQAAGDEPEEEDPYVGQVLLGQFEVEAVIGEGGMGRVYRARQHGFDRPVAIKILHADLVTNTEMVKRFNREAKIISRLDHPGIIHVYLFGELPDHNLYLAMEYVDGESLTVLIADGPVPVDKAVHIAQQILGALTEAHRKGVVHRDLKPDNIMLVERPDDPLSVKVLDFGIAKFLGSRTMLTQQGLVFGSARYISPEAAAGETVDERADLYAVGVILYQMLAGRPPFDDSSAVALLMRHVNDPPPPLLDQPGAKDVPPAIAAVVMQSLKKEPSHRFDDANAMRAALTEAAKVEGVPLLGQDVGGISRSWASPPPASPPAEPEEEAAKTLVDDRGSAFHTDPMFGAALSGVYPRPNAAEPATQAPDDPDAPHGPTTQISSKPFKETKADSLVPPPTFVIEATPAPVTLQPEESPRSSSPEHSLANDDDEVRLPKSRAWIVLVVLLLLAVAGGAIAALFSGGDDEGAGPDTETAPNDPLPAIVSSNAVDQPAPPRPAADAGVTPRAPSVEVTAGATATKSAQVGTIPIRPEDVVPPQDAMNKLPPALQGVEPSPDEPQEPMPPAASLVIEPRRPTVGRNVQLMAKVSPPSPLRSPRFVITQRGGDSTTVPASPDSEGSYSAQHSFGAAGSYQINFIASSDRGDLRAFSDITVTAPRPAKRPDPGLRDVPDFQHPTAVPGDPSNKPPDSTEPSLLPPW